MKLFVFFCFLCISSNIVFSQSVTGIWRTVDDQSGIDKSLVEIYLNDGRLFGKVVKILDTSDGENPLCNNCKGSLRNKPILGMQIINGLKKKGDEWSGNNGLFDPETGRDYNGKIWLEDRNTLKVRGYVGFFYRTQTWHRVK